jgi:hypothetical protein
MNLNRSSSAEAQDVVRNLNRTGPNLAYVAGKSRGVRDPILTDYVRTRLVELNRQIEAEGSKSLSERAEDVGLPKSSPSQVISKKMGISGAATAERYAKLLGFASALELIQAAHAKKKSGQHTVVRVHRYHVMATVLEAAASDGIPDEFVRNFETGLDLPGQPSFSIIYELLKSTWNAERQKTRAAPIDKADF